jgi:hypothetical protein
VRSPVDSVHLLLHTALTILRGVYAHGTCSIGWNAGLGLGLGLWLTGACMAYCIVLCVVVFRAVLHWIAFNITLPTVAELRILLEGSRTSFLFFFLVLFSKRIYLHCEEVWRMCYHQRRFPSLHDIWVFIGFN